MATSVTSAPFVNEPFLDFSNPEIKREQQAALEAVEARLGHEYDLVIGGKRIQTAAKITSVNPARPAQIVGIHQAAGPEHAPIAMAAAQAAFPVWSSTPVQTRVEFLLRAAELIRERKYIFNAWLTYEAGKNWAEADADTAECIDFLEFYAREALRLDAATTPIQLPGEHNTLRYVPLGVGAVIPPWNFPFAIMAGMTAAAIVTGNTVILKPSVDAPTIAAVFFALLEEIGLPDGVVNFCPGEGPGFGAAIVAHPQTRFIAFTGSKKVGLEIHESAAKTQPGQRFIKRTILEMGGKDAIIVDANCDLSLAVDGVVASAFGFNGQKCSACSRAIVDASIYEAFVDLLKEKVEAIQQGDPAKNYYAGPVISPVAMKRVLDYIEVGKSEARLLLGGEPVSNEGGFYIAPTVFVDVPPTARIALEEIFGPVLAVMRAKDFEDAMRIANNIPFGLSASIQTQNVSRVFEYIYRMEAGLLTVNLPSAGVEYQLPFGGTKDSSFGPKEQGPAAAEFYSDYKTVYLKY